VKTGSIHRTVLWNKGVEMIGNNHSQLSKFGLQQFSKVGLLLNLLCTITLSLTFENFYQGV